MTIAATADEIAKRFFGAGEERGDLELAILRHMEHHSLRAAVQEREACVQVVLLGHKEQWTHMQIVDEIRARKSVDKPFAQSCNERPKP